MEDGEIPMAKMILAKTKHLHLIKGRNMKKIILITILLISLISSPSWSETLTMDDLVEKEDLLFYKKFSFFLL